MAQEYAVDANVTLALFLRLPYSLKVEQHMREWQAEAARVAVPALWEYECLTGFRRAVALKLVPPDEAHRMVEELLALEFQRVAPTAELHHAALRWAEQIGQSKAHDGQYLALAESLSAEFWTTDERLVHAVQTAGVKWIHLI